MAPGGNATLCGFFPPAPLRLAPSVPVRVSTGAGWRAIERRRLAGRANIPVSVVSSNSLIMPKPSYSIQLSYGTQVDTGSKPYQINKKTFFMIFIRWPVHRSFCCSK
jgi:hypothetical protein